MSTAEHSDHLPEVLPGQIVGGKWKIVAPIGRGGMGAVFEGQNISIGKKVALKFIDAEFARQPEIASRFQREAEAASLVESAHIVHIFDSGATESGIPYIVMELLRGEDLRARLRRMGRLPKEEAVHIVAQTLRGLYRAHEAGIVHRDLKPDNIFLVDRDDDPLFAKIVDFGISKMMRRPGDATTSTLTRQGVVLGTPFYMSPEQAQALPNLDVRTDLWSIGAILYECLAGRPPHLGDAYEQIIVSICTTDAPPLRSIDPSIPEALAAIVHRALARNVNQRFQTAKEMLDALVATGIGPQPFASATPRIASPGPVATQGAPDGAGTEVAGGRTRVSWTTGEPKSPVLATVPQMEERRSRARAVRRGGLLLLGAAVMLAAYILTSGILRSRRAQRSATAKPTVTASASAPAAASATDSIAVDVRSTTGATAHAAAPPPAGASKTKKQAGAGTGASTAPSPQSQTPASPSAAPAKTGGVAGGLQIKTNYP